MADLLLRIDNKIYYISAYVDEIKFDKMCVGICTQEITTDRSE